MSHKLMLRKVSSRLEYLRKHDPKEYERAEDRLRTAIRRAKIRKR